MPHTNFPRDAVCMATSSELLTLVDSAVETRLAGGSIQSYSVGSVNIAYCPLTELVKLRDKLRAEVALANRSRMTFADMSMRVS